MRIKDIPISVLNAALLDAICDAYQVAGYNIPVPKDLAKLVDLTSSDMRKYYRNNTLDDIKKVFDLGSHGEYGDYTGLSAKVFYQWMKTYNGLVVNVQPTEDDTSQQPQRETTPEDGRNLVNSCYDTYCKLHMCLVPASVLLPILEREGVYTPTDWERTDAEVRAEGALTSEYLKKHEAFKSLANHIADKKTQRADELLLTDFFEAMKQKNKSKIF